MILIAISIVIAIFLFTARDTHNSVFLIVAASIDFLLFSFALHGLIATSLPPEKKGKIIFYPIWMWGLWVLLFLLFVFFVIPLFCPDFSFFF